MADPRPGTPLEQEHDSLQQKKTKHRQNGLLKTWLIVALIIAVSAVTYFLLERNAAPPKRKEKVFSNPDGSVPKVEEYIRKNMLQDSSFFEAVHWTPLRKTGELFGNVTYRVGVIYKKKNEKNEVVMDSKLIEIDENGSVLFVLDAGPINNK
jgi:hypothetical protein